jgi:hypothetical protein
VGFSLLGLLCMALEALESESLTTNSVVAFCVEVALCEYDVADFSRKSLVVVVSEC